MTKAVSIFPPSQNGVYRVYCAMREELIPLGIDLRWLFAGVDGATEVQKHASEADMRKGVLLEPTEGDGAKLGRAVVEYIEREKVELVLLHGLSLQWSMNVARYLPEHIRKVLMVHTSSPSSYRGAAALRDCLHATICVSPRISNDLLSAYGFSPEWTITIPNGIDTQAFARITRKSNLNLEEPLRILSHGRIDEQSKGIFWIPEILKRVRDAGVKFNLTVSGDGPDLSALRSRVSAAGLSDSTTFLGWTPSEKVSSLVSEHDVLLFTSRFEGSSLVVMEAMAGGCVPVASRICGITDFIVKDGETGFLFPIGRRSAAVEQIIQLGTDRSLLSRLSRSGRSDIQARFSFSVQSEYVANIFRRVMDSPCQVDPPLSLADWSLPRGLRPAWWYYLPESLKNQVRAFRERWVLRTADRRP